MTNADGKSYVRSLLDAGPAKIDAKLREEAGELGDALMRESDERVLSEAADLLFHALVGLAARDLSIADVAAVAALFNCNSPLMNFASMSSQLPCGVSGPVYLLGRPTRSCAPRYGMLFRLSAFAAASSDFVLRLRGQNGLAQKRNFRN